MGRTGMAAVFVTVFVLISTVASSPLSDSVSKIKAIKQDILKGEFSNSKKQHMLHSLQALVSDLKSATQAHSSQDARQLASRMHRDMAELKRSASEMRHTDSHIHRETHQKKAQHHSSTKKVARDDPVRQLNAESIAAVKHTLSKIRSSGKLKSHDLKTVKAFSLDLEMLQRSTDPAQNKDLVEAITLRLPAVQALAHHLQAQERAARNHMDLEEEGDQKTGIESDKNDQSPHDGKDLATKGISALQEAKGLLGASSLPQAKKDKYAKLIADMMQELKKASTSDVSTGDQAEIASHLRETLVTLKEMHQEIDASGSEGGQVNVDENGEGLEDRAKEKEHQILLSAEEEEKNSLSDEKKNQDDDDQGDHDANEGEENGVAGVDKNTTEQADVNTADHVSETVTDEKEVASTADNAEMDHKSDSKGLEKILAKKQNFEEVDHQVNLVAATSLSKLHDLQAAIKNSHLNTNDKAQYLSNLESLEKDTKALQDPGLNDIQKADLESAVQLRVAMMQDMEAMLVKKRILKK